MTLTITLTLLTLTVTVRIALTLLTLILGTVLNIAPKLNVFPDIYNWSYCFEFWLTWWQISSILFCLLTYVTTRKCGCGNTFGHIFENRQVKFVHQGHLVKVKVTGDQKMWLFNAYGRRHFIINSECGVEGLIFLVCAFIFGTVVLYTPSTWHLRLSNYFRIKISFIYLSVCLSFCPPVCNALFKRLDLESSCLLCRYIFRIVRSSSYIEDIWSKSSSRESKCCDIWMHMELQTLLPPVNATW